MSVLLLPRPEKQMLDAAYGADLQNKNYRSEGKFNPSLPRPSTL